ncbi:MAG: TSUP family transporter [Oscillospiraceae bacterium]|nr:TSUP family transporter [Oscillospiraceae bacterium]
MVTSFPVCLAVGTVLGFLSGLGVGGGSLLVLWLTLAAGMEPEQARILNLLFFLPCALIACLFRWRQGVLQPGKVLPAIVSGCLAAFLFSRISLDTGLLKKAFGLLLLFTGLRELTYKP